MPWPAPPGSPGLPTWLLEVSLLVFWRTPDSSWGSPWLSGEDPIAGWPVVACCCLVWPAAPDCGCSTRVLPGSPKHQVHQLIVHCLGGASLIRSDCTGGAVLQVVAK